MINEAVQFMKLYEKNKGNKDANLEIERILENPKINKIIIVETDYKKDKLSFANLKILLKKVGDEYNTNINNIIQMEDWLKENSKYASFLDFEKYIYPMGKSKAALDKMIGSTQSLMTFSLFHFIINEKWFEWKKDKKDKEYFKFNKKIDKLKLPSKFFTFSGNEEKIRNIIKTFNEKEDLRDIYRKLIEELLKMYNLNKDSFKNNENVKNFLNFIRGTFVFLKINENLADIYNLFYNSFLEFKIFNKEEYTRNGKCPFCNKNNILIGVPNNFCSFDEDKFPNFHNTKADYLNIRLCRSCCKKLNSFEQFLRKYNIDFFPLFIKDNFKLEELNYLKNKMNFFDVLEHINKISDEKELDFILLHYKRDILFYDYINNYKIKLGKFKSYLLHDIVTNSITLNQLRGKFTDKDILGLKSNDFFGEVKGDSRRKYLIYKYRQKIFDIIYRNQKNLSDEDIKEMTVILLENKIRNNERKQKNSIYKMLDLYLNSDLFIRYPNIFIQKNNSGENMLEQIRREKQEIIGNNITPIIDSDEKFAYYLGQMINYLISQSEAQEDKKMGLLLPIISCQTSQSLQIIVANKYLDKYGYKLRAYYDFKHKIISAILDYLNSCLKVPFTKIKIPFYVGFFDDNIFNTEK